MSTAPQPGARPPSAAAVRTTSSAKAPPPSASVIKSQDAGRGALRRGVYALLMTLSVGVMIGRVLAVTSVDQIGVEKILKSQGREDWQKQRPFLSGNDRSRWLTVRALVEKGTYAIDQYVTDPKTHPNWDTIDMVMHQDASGAPHLYSSKPPLLATLYAMPYWIEYQLTKRISGTPATLGTHPYEIGRSLLILFNVLPLLLYFWVLSKIVERLGASDWGSLFVMAAATFATFLTTFAIAVNNHLPAAVSITIALFAWLRIWYDGERNWYYFALAGLFAAFAAACELPALSFFGLVSVALLWKAPRQTLLAYLPATLVVVAAWFATNWAAHGSLLPAYAHRTYDATDSSAATPQSDPARYSGTLTLESGQTVELSGNPNNWYDYKFTRTDGREAQSYWLNPQGIDASEASVGKYSFNLLVGHHGIFSLTPIFLLAIPGLFLLWFGANYRLRDLAIMTALLSVVCIVFYILRPMADRNYGGMTSGVRWVFWLTPLWLIAALPTADWMGQRRWTRGVAYVLLALSAISASYPIWNPWTHPWLMNFFIYMGWA
jgi:hypothetical protein